MPLFQVSSSVINEIHIYNFKEATSIIGHSLRDDFSEIDQETGKSSFSSNMSREL